LALSNREVLGIGNDAAPIRLIILQLLYLLNRRLNVTSDGYGLKPSLNAYLSQFSPPKFEIGVGNVAELANPGKPYDAAADSGSVSTRYVAAKDHSQVKAASVEPTPEPSQAELPQEIVAPAADPQPPAEAPAAVQTDADSQPESADQAVVFDKPSPFKSAPVPSVEEPAPATPQRSPAPVAPLGSAPIPSMKPAAEAAEAPSAGDANPPKPPVDFELDSQNDGANEDKAEVKEEAYLNTVVIPQIAVPPSTAPSSKDAAQKTSTDAFIARVKKQLTTCETAIVNEKDSFSSTIPQ
jgi:hypothetical protein